MYAYTQAVCVVCTRVITHTHTHTQDAVCESQTSRSSTRDVLFPAGAEGRGDGSGGGRFPASRFVIDGSWSRLNICVQIVGYTEAKFGSVL